MTPEVYHFHLWQMYIRSELDGEDRLFIICTLYYCLYNMTLLRFMMALLDAYKTGR